MFSDEVKKVIEEAGWYPNRQIDISEYVEALQKEGYEVPEKLKEFLREFGGLYLKVPGIIFDSATLKQYPILKEWQKKNKPYRITHFNVIEAIWEPAPVPMTKEDIFEPRVGEDLILFGEVDDGRFDLNMTPSGKVYAKDGAAIYFLGNNYMEMFEHVIHNKPYVIVD